MQNTYNGLLIDTIVVKDQDSKELAKQKLSDWKDVNLTAREWIAHLEQGHIIQPSNFTSAPDGKYAHVKEYWQSTHFVCCDADNIKGVEFLRNGKDKNPDGIAPFTSETDLFALYPTLQDNVYAVCQSVSSMHKDPLHRRYRLIFRFDEPIMSVAHYHSILLFLAAQYPIIPPVKRSPAQPVFGNARAGYNSAAIYDNTLRLSDYPIPEPENRTRDTQAVGSATDAALYNILTKNSIPFQVRPKGGFFVRCPNSEQHTDGRCRRTDSYVFVGDSGAFAFHCSHTSCQSTGKSSWAAFKNGYSIKGQSPTYTAKQRLFINPDAEHVKTDVMDTIRSLLQEDVLEWLQKEYDAEKPQVLIINTGTATGKSHAIIATLENLVMLTPTKELAEEAYGKALELGKSALLHLSRWHNWTKYRTYLENPSLNRTDLKLSRTDPDGVGCVYPDRCDAILQKGHSARNKFCENLCDRRGECKSHGYLSQFRIYQDADETKLQVYTAQPQDAITDAELQETIHAYGLNRDDTVLVVDEADPMKMIPLRQIRYEVWRKAKAYYNLPPAGVFFDMLLQETATVPNRVTAKNTEEQINAISENGLAFRDAIQRAFDAFEQYLKQQGKTLKQGLKQLQAMFDEVASRGLDKMDIDTNLDQLHDGHPAKIDAQIEALPPNHAALIDNLQALLESTKDSKTPPIRNIGEGTWEFAVPPVLNAKKIVYLTASHTTSLLRAQLKHVNVEITQTKNRIAPWLPDNKLYQLNTGRYTPRSFYEVTKRSMFTPKSGKVSEDDTATLSARGEECIELVIGTLADRKKTLIVAPGAFCEDGILFDDPLIQQLHRLPNSHIATHQHAIGVNRYSDLHRAMVFHYEPHLLDFTFNVKVIFPRETLSFERVQVDYMTPLLILERVYRYSDTRVQQVYDAMCANTMMQSENRIRPQLHENREVWRLTAEPIPAPITPVLFSIPDWRAWIETAQAETFDVFLQSRANRSVPEVAAQDNVSESTAYRRTKAARKENKAARDAEIIRLHKEGHKQSDIVMHVSKHFRKVSQGTVSNVIKRHTNQ